MNPTKHAAWRSFHPLINPETNLSAGSQYGGRPFLAASWHDLLDTHERVVDETTWQDLAMDDVFGRIDRTMGMPGRQLLYHWMRTYETDNGVLAERARQYATLRSGPGFREEAQMILGALDGPSASWLAPLLLQPFPCLPWFSPLLGLSGLMGLLTVGGIIFFPFLFPYLVFLLLVLITVNIVINETYGKEVTAYFPGFSQVATLLGICIELGRMENPHGLPQVDFCRQSSALAAKLRAKVLWLAQDRSRNGDLMDTVLGYLNMVLLVDILAFLRCLRALKRNREDLLAILDAVASLDATISVASYLDGVPSATTPIFGESRTIRVKGLYHPLLNNPVSNDLNLAAAGALITGSNMAGKTTFMRTVGVNLILARTLNFSLADFAEFPRAEVLASIRREDNLKEGQSYYFAELERILSFVRNTDDGRLRLFLIDEIFRGTNTNERLASSAVMLRHLSKNNMVIVTTHDLELQGLIGDAFITFHFSEQVKDGSCAFDYKIQNGLARSRNAIRLLEVVGFPEPLTREARVLADWIAEQIAGFGQVQGALVPAARAVVTGPEWLGE